MKVSSRIIVDLDLYSKTPPRGVLLENISAPEGLYESVPDVQTSAFSQLLPQ